MNEEEVRAMVREAIARRTRAERTGIAGPVPGFREQASYLLFPLASGGDGDGACLIEPAVRCNRCGYCLSYGH